MPIIKNNKIGIRILLYFSIPLFTPLNTTNAVIIKKINIQMIG